MTSVQSATDVVISAFSAIEKDDWASVSELTAPEIIDRFRAGEIAQLLAWAEYIATREQTGASGYSSNAVIKPELLARYGHVKLERIEGAPSIADLAAAQPKTFFANWLRLGHSARPRYAHTQPEVPREILGAVPEGEDLVHVLYRGMEWIPILRVRIMPVALREGRWFLLQNDDILRRTPHMLLIDDLGPRRKRAT